VGILLTYIESSEIENIAKQFFQQNYFSFDIVSTTRKKNIWSVKGFVTQFGQQLSRIITIDSETGKIIDIE
jgi:hypothetical protein